MTNHKHIFYLDDESWQQLRQIALDRKLPGASACVREAVELYLSLGNLGKAVPPEQVPSRDLVDLPL